MKHGYNFIGLAFLLALLIGGCGLLGSDDENGTEENGEEISLEDLPGTLVFSALADDGNFQIFTMKPDGTELTQLTFREQFEDDRGFSGYEPSWSPDGEQIVFTTEYKYTTLGLTLWVMNADGSDPRPLYDPAPDDPGMPAMWGDNPRWSPDGTKIAFGRCVGCSVSTNLAIFVFDLETEQLTRLTEEPPMYQSYYPYWSPDGTQIAFTTNRDYVDADTLRFRQDLYVMEADGSNQTRITTTGNATRPIWSPDGNMIAYDWARGGNNIFLVQYSSGQITHVDTEMEFSGTPMWNNEGNKLLVRGRKNEHASPELRLLAINPNDGTHEVLLFLDIKPGGNNYSWFIP